MNSLIILIPEYHKLNLIDAYDDGLTIISYFQILKNLKTLAGSRGPTRDDKILAPRPSKKELFFFLYFKNSE